MRVWLGINCRYNAKNVYNEEIFNLVKNGEALPICAEQLGGLSTPRNPAEIRIINGKKYVIDNKGNDVTYEFIKGAEEVLNLAKKLGIKKAILKSKSPSCGKGKIYSGNFDGELVDGNGILAEILIQNGIEVISL